MKVFVTCGTWKTPMVRLIKRLEVLEDICDFKFYLQKGAEYETPLFGVNVMGRFEFESMIKISDVIISHAGIGNIQLIRKYDKPCILVPRLACYNEHTDNHQLEWCVDHKDDCNWVVDVNKITPELIRNARKLPNSQQFDIDTFRKVILQ